jgi:hypothetical protein
MQQSRTLIRSRLSLALIAAYGAVLILLGVRAAQRGLVARDYLLIAVSIYMVADGLFRKAPLEPSVRRLFVGALIAAGVLLVLMALQSVGLF